MIKKVFYSLFFLFTLCQCNKTPKSTCLIYGEVQGLENGQIVIWGIDKLYNRTDTLLAEQGIFRAELPVDTLTEATLLTPDGNEYPLFLKKGGKVHVYGSLPDSLSVTGVAQNDSIYQLLAIMEQPENQSTERQTELAEDFIRTHPSDIASLYVLRRFFIGSDTLNIERMKSVLGLLGPDMHDYSLVSQLDDYLTQAGSIGVGKAMPSFSIPNRDRKVVNRYSYNGKTLLMHFWASWDTLSRQQNSSFRELYTKYKKNKNEKKNKKNLEMLGISLDGEREQWIQAIEEDSIEWEQLCNLKAWETEIVKRIGLDQLPTSYLINDRGNILKINPTLQDIEEEIANITDK